MAKCKKCGRKSLFFKVNSEGLCADCVILTEIEKKKQEMEAFISDGERKLDEIQKKISFKNEEMEALISEERKKLAEVQNSISLKNEELNRLETDRQKTYNTIKRQAESAAIANVNDKLAELDKEQLQKNKEIDRLNAIIKQKEDEIEPINSDNTTSTKTEVSTSATAPTLPKDDNTVLELLAYLKEKDHLSKGHNNKIVKIKLMSESKDMQKAIAHTEREKNLPGNFIEFEYDNEKCMYFFSAGNNDANYGKLGYAPTEYNDLLHKMEQDDDLSIIDEETSMILNFNTLANGQKYVIVEIMYSEKSKNRKSEQTKKPINFPAEICGIPCSYSYTDVHVCIIRGREPDMDKVKECAGKDTTVIAKLEPENPYDNEAVALYTANDIQIGYLYKSRLKDMAYDYLKKDYPIKAQFSKIEDKDIYIDIAFYSSKKGLNIDKEVCFTLISRSEEMQENLSFAEVNEELEFEYSFEKGKIVFTLEGDDIGYAPSKYTDLLNEIEPYCSKIIKLSETESGNISAKVCVQYIE